MVFYIEACESGSMMENLPDNVDGELSFRLAEGWQEKVREQRRSVRKLNNTTWTFPPDS